MNIIKPPRWNISPALVAPEYRGLWRDLIFVDLLRDPQPRDELQAFGDGTITGATASTTAWGSAYTFDGTTEKIAYTPDLRMREITEADHSVTMVVKGRQLAETHAGTLLRMADATLVFTMFQLSDGTFQFSWDDNVVKKDVAGAIVYDDVLVVASAIRRGDTYYNYVAGVEQASTAISTDYTIGATEFLYGNTSFAANEHFDGDILAVYVHERGLSSAEHNLLVQDPFGVVRQQPPVFVAPATFPVTSAYMYKKITDVSAEPTTWDFVLAGGAAPQAAVAGAFRKVSTTHLDASGTTVTSTNDMTPDAPDITSVNDGAMAITMHGYGYNSTAPTGGAPSGYTLVALAQGGSGNRGGSAMAYKTKPTAGLDAIGDWTHSPDNGVAEFHVRTIALAPGTPSVISEGPGIDDVTTSLNLVSQEAGIDHSDLYRNTASPATDGSIIQNNITPSAGDVIVDGSVASDTSYVYMLRDWEEVGETNSTDSNEITIRTAPARPTVLTEVATGQSFIDISWTDNTDQPGGTGPHKHRVYYREQGDPGWILATPNGVAAGTSTYRIQPGLEAGTAYDWTVTAWNPSG